MTPRETYLHGHHESVVSQHAMRTAGEAAAFVRPFLRSDMRLIDIGCGPGSITAGLAEWLDSGEVVGVDQGSGVLEAARADATERGLSNLRYLESSVYSMQFGDAEFDVAYAHQVLQHLSEPGAMLAEARRVLRPGGLIAVREVDWGSAVWWPESNVIARFRQIYDDVARRNGGEPNMGRRLRDLFERAEFADVRVGAGVWGFGDVEQVRSWGESWSRRTVESDIAATAVEYGISDDAELESLSQGWLEWSREPGAYFSFIHAEAIGWKSK